MADSWFKIADDLSDLQFCDRGISEIKVNSLDICVIKQKDGLFACNALCPHAGARFAEHAYINNQAQIVCCVHNYKFNLKTGRDVFNEGYFLKVYPVRSTEDGVFIQI